MSTNYYLPQASGTALHIGKRSMGWTFMFRAQPQARSRAAWERLVAEVGTVTTEDGMTLAPDKFWAVVDATREPHNGQSPRTIAGGRLDQARYTGDPRARATRLSLSDYVDEDGWDFTDADFS